MKALFILCIIIAGCAINPLPDTVPQFDTVQEAADWVYSSITYIRDEVRHCQSPEETLARGAGDCEDLTHLVQAIAWDQFEINVDMVIGKEPKGYHATPMLGEIYLHHPIWHSRHFHPIDRLSYAFTVAIRPILGDEIARIEYENNPIDLPLTTPDSVVWF